MVTVMDADRGLRAILGAHGLEILRTRDRVQEHPAAKGTDRRKAVLAQEAARIVREQFGLDGYREHARCEVPFDVLMATLHNASRYGLQAVVPQWRTPAAGAWWIDDVVPIDITQYLGVDYAWRGGRLTLKRVRQNGCDPVSGNGVLFQEWGRLGFRTTRGERFPERHGIYAGLDALVDIRRENDRGAAVTAERSGAPIMRSRRHYGKAAKVASEIGARGTSIDLDAVIDEWAPAALDDAETITAATDATIEDTDLTTVEPVEMKVDRGAHLATDWHIDAQYAYAIGALHILSGIPGQGGGYNKTAALAGHWGVTIDTHHRALLTQINGPPRAGGGLVGWLVLAHLGHEGLEVLPWIVPASRSRPTLLANLANVVGSVNAGVMTPTDQLEDRVREALEVEPLDPAERRTLAERLMGQSMVGERTGGERGGPAPPCEGGAHETDRPGPSNVEALAEHNAARLASLLTTVAEQAERIAQLEEAA